ncbi:MAG TPA: hypothetical protein GX404_04750 [Syntrophomonadaceae bacterium]|nr:hypothetical protein [Syntrophomonadaceae bacterium]
MSKYYYYVNLQLNQTTERGASVDLETLLDDILDAADYMNSAYQKTRCLLIMQVHDLEIDLMLLSSTPMQPQDIADELRVFSGYLIDECGWSVLSSDPSLFIMNPERMYEFNPWQAQLALFDSGHDLMQLEEWFDPLFESPEAVDQQPQKPEMQETEPIEEISDEQMLSALRFIIDVQNLGSYEAVSRKKDLLQRIKNLLLPWTHL